MRAVRLLATGLSVQVGVLLLALSAAAVEAPAGDGASRGAPVQPPPAGAASGATAAPVVSQPPNRAEPEVAPGAAVAPASAEDAKPKLQPVELWLGLGLGNAVCDNEKPDSDCPVETGGAAVLGGAWRISQRWALGLELAGWSFGVRDEWRGQLEDSATDVTFGSSYLALIARWYWLAELGSYHGYLQFGLGAGGVEAEAKDASGASYRVRTSGAVFPLGIGFDFALGDVFRLGPQALAYLQVSSQRCEEINGGGETCVDSTDDDNALPYRLVLMGTFNFGD